MDINKFTLVQFLINEVAADQPQLRVRPRPDTIIRIFLLLKPMAERVKMTTTPPPVERIERHGFTLLEWGAMNLSKSPPMMI